MSKKIGSVVVFQYRANHRPQAPVKQPTGKPIVDRSDEMEQLSGVVQGYAASDLEERFARSLDDNRNVINYEFQANYISGRNIQGAITVDFVVYTGLLPQPVQIDGEFAHKTQSQREHDTMNDAILNNYTQGWAAPVVRIPYSDLDNQDMADRLVKEMFG